jgi:hypothetical protein
MDMFMDNEKYITPLSLPVNPAIRQNHPNDRNRMSDAKNEAEYNKTNY